MAKRPTRGLSATRIPGSALAEAWCLWEAPLGPLLDWCPEQSRGKAKEMLSGAVTFAE